MTKWGVKFVEIQGSPTRSGLTVCFVGIPLRCRRCFVYYDRPYIEA